MEIGFQCGLSVNDGAADADTPFHDHATVTLPDLDITVHEYATHGQEHFFWRNLPGMIKSGTLKVEMYYSAAQYTRVRTLAVGRAVKTWIVSQPEHAAGEDDPQEFPIEGFISKLPGHTYERDGITMFSFELTPSGEWGPTEETPDP